MIRRLALTLSGGMFMAGVLALVVGLIASSRRDPTAVTWDGATFLVKRREAGQIMAFDFVRPGDGTVAVTVAGSTDLVCEPPHLMLIDIDGDAEPEVYFTTCDESGFVDFRGGENLIAVELSEHEAAQMKAIDSFWFRQIQDGGWVLLSSGALGIVGGLGTGGMTLLFSYFARKKRHNR